MKILLTGGLGFIGSHLAEQLENNALTLVTRSYSKRHNLSHLGKKTTIKKLDITSFEKLGTLMRQVKPDVIFHLAGQTSHSKSFENPLGDIDSNSKSTLFMLEKIRQLDLKCKFILGSTFVVVGRPQKLPVDEQSPCNPTTIYGANRLASEHYCRIYHDVYGLDTRTFRITNSFGPREQHIANKNAVNYLIYRAYKGQEITIFDKGMFFRDLIYVSDVISGIKKILQKGKSGNLYWISSRKKTWFYQIGKWLEELTGTTVKYLDPPKYTKKVDVGNFVVDNSKLKALGWEPKISVKDGIKRTLDYFDSRGI